MSHKVFTVLIVQWKWFISKETVVVRWWGSETLKFGFKKVNNIRRKWTSGAQTNATVGQQPNAMEFLLWREIKDGI